MSLAVDGQQKSCTPVYPLHGLRITTRDEAQGLRRVAAEIIGVRPRGLEVLMLTPLEPEAELEVSFRLGWDGRGLVLRGTARVDYCRPEPSGLFRVGLSCGDFWFQLRPFVLDGAQAIASPSQAA